MKTREAAAFNKVLCTVLSLLMVFTVGWSTSGYGFTDAVRSFILDDVAPMAEVAQAAEVSDDDVLAVDVPEEAPDDLEESSGWDEMPDETAQANPDVAAQADPDAAAPAPEDEVGDEEISLSEEELAQAAEEERQADPTELGYIPGEIIVVYENEADEVERDAAVEAVDGESVGEEADFEMGDVGKVEISDDLTVEAAAEIIEADPAVKYAVPNYVAVPFDVPYQGESAAPLAQLPGLSMDASWQWHLDYIDAPEAWDLIASKRTAVENPVKVAIIDTGASVTHPDLMGVMDADASIEVVHPSSSYNYSDWSSSKLRGDGYTNGGKTRDDLSSHGTHVAGIVAAEGGNGGVDGVASGGGTALKNQYANLVVMDAFSEYRDGKALANTYDLIFCLLYARDTGCSVVNLSLGFSATGDSTKAMFDEIASELTNKNDMLLVAAAGNDGARSELVPAACNDVIGVVSVSSKSMMPSGYVVNSFNAPLWLTGDVTKSSFSTYGPWYDLAAPGELVGSTVLLTTGVNGYGLMSGTSMASPVVAGTAALVRAVAPDLSAVAVRNVLCSTATDLHTAGFDEQSGFGAVNAYDAVAQALALDDAASSGQYVDPSTGATSPAPEATKVALGESSVSLTQTVLSYTGAAQRPGVVVKVSGRTLTQGTDYTLSWSSSSPINIGTYTVRVTGAGRYTGTVTRTFRIDQADISRAQMTLGSQLYTGRPLTPAPTVKLGGRTLRAGTDYDVRYVNNTAIGTAQAIATGKGNYRGQCTGTYRIYVPAASVAYACHVQNIGWQAEAKDGARGGTSGRALRVEGFRVRLVNQPYSGDIRVSAHVQNIGWQNWVTGSAMASGRAIAGTSGRALRVEAIKVELTGDMANRYDVYYRTHVQNVGDTGWAKNGEACGSAGYGYRMEAAYIKLVPKGSAAPGSTANCFVQPLVSYQTHVQNIGWQSPVFDGATGGTSGRGLRVEAFKVKLVGAPYSGGIEVSSHVQNIGWQGWVANGALSGTSGRALRVEALRIRLTGQMASRYDVYYRTHVQNIGWTGWAKNGENCGSAGYAYRMEAVQIKLVPKGASAPGTTARHFYQR